MSKLVDLTGKVFTRLIVLGRSSVPEHVVRVRKETYWLCRCSCGETRTVTSSSLTSGRQKSCGCLRKERIIAASTTHGYAGADRPRAYGIWTDMLKRCRNKHHKYYHLYGGRGIKVCERWCKFENFLADMGEVPDGLTLDRYPNNNGNYEPGNCRWATAIEQANNKNNNHYITINGTTKTLAEWSVHTGINKGTISSRINGYGWSEERAVMTPIRQHKEYEPRQS